MFIDVSDIRKSPGRAFHFDFSETVEPLSVGMDEVALAGPVVVSVDVKNTGRVLIFSGHIRSDTKLLCSRCLEYYPYHLDVDFEEKFCHASDVSDITEEGQDIREMHVFEGNRIDIDDMVTENILLSIPMKSICGENCRGLCAICGKNLNVEQCGCKVDDIDPRLSALKKFFE